MISSKVEGDGSWMRGRVRSVRLWAARRRIGGIKGTSGWERKGPERGKTPEANSVLDTTTQVYLSLYILVIKPQKRSLAISSTM